MDLLNENRNAVPIHEPPLNYEKPQMPYLASVNASKHVFCFRGNKPDSWCETTGMCLFINACLKADVFQRCRSLLESLVAVNVCLCQQIGLIKLAVLVPNQDWTVVVYNLVRAQTVKPGETWFSNPNLLPKRGEHAWLFRQIAQLPDPANYVGFNGGNHSQKH